MAASERHSWLLAVLLGCLLSCSSATDCTNYTQPRFLPGLPGMQPASATEAQLPKVSVVLMNWKRSENVKLILNAMERYNSVDEVLVLMCNPATKFTINSTKAQALDFTGLETTWGLTARFKGCLLARNPWVLIMDDDLFLTEGGLEQLIRAKANNTERLISYYGRTYNESKTYMDPGKPGLHPIALTKVLLTDVRFCHAFFQLSPVMSDMAHADKVHWNGEDIFMSLVARKVTGQDHLIFDPLPADVQELSQGDGGISWIVKGHHHGDHRTNFLRAAIDRLGCVQTGGHRGVAALNAASARP